MDEQMQNKLRERTRTQANPQNLQDYEGKLANMEQTITGNMNQMEGFVEQNLFSDAKTKAAQAQNDYNRDYIFQDVHKSVETVNSKVMRNIEMYGKAEPTRADIAAKKKKFSFRDAWKKVTGTVEATADKDGLRRSAELEGLKETNQHVTYATVFEMEKLIKYTESHQGYIDKNGSKFKDFCKARLKNLPRANKRAVEDAIKKKTYSEYCFGVLPFLKTYKKSWWKYYTLDGKRLKFNKGDEKPDAFNKRLLETLRLETDKDRVSDKKTLEANRKKKGEMLATLTRELLKDVKKVDPKKMTEKYVSEHIVELQNLSDRIRAYQLLLTKNSWFLWGKDAGNKQLQPKDAADPQFVYLVKNKILGMADPLANFLEAHLNSHGIKSNANFSKRKYGFRQLSNEEKNNLSFFDENSKLDMRSDLRDVQEQSERLSAFGNAYDVVDMTNMSEEDKKQYNLNVNFEKNLIKNGTRQQVLQYGLDRTGKEYQATIAKDIQNLIGRDMSAYKTSNDKKVKDAIKNGNADIVNMPYLSMTDPTAGIELKYIQDKIKRSKNREMYMYYAPEIDHLYGQFYATCRLETELIARKRTLDKTFNISKINNLKKALEAPNLQDNVKASHKKDIEALNKKNLQTVKYTCGNKYAKFNENIVKQARIDTAFAEYDEVDRKLEYIRYNRVACRKVLDYVLRDPAEKITAEKDMSVVNRYLQKENMGYLIDLEKIDIYDNLLDDAMEKVRVDQNDAAGVDGIILEQNRPGKKKVDKKARGGRIFNVRRRARLLDETKQAKQRFQQVPIEEGKLFEKIMVMTPEEFGSYKFNGMLPLHKNPMHPDDKVDHPYQNDNFNYVVMCQYAGKRQGLFSKNYYGDKPSMMMEFDALKKKKLIPQNANFNKFMADVATKMEILAERYPYISTVYTDQLTESYAYLDTDRLDEMDSVSLERLKEHLNAKAIELKEKYDQVRGNVPENLLELNLADDGKHIEKPKVSDDMMWLLRRRKQQYESAKELAMFVARRINIVKGISKYENFTEQAYQIRYGKKLEELEIEDAKEEFAFADLHHIRIKKALTVHVESGAQTDIGRMLLDAKKKEPNLVQNDKKLLETVMTYVTRLRTIEIGPTLLSKAQKNMSSIEAPEVNEFAELLSVYDTVSNLRTLVEAGELWESAEMMALKRMLSEKPEYAELWAEIKNKVEILAPFVKAMDACVGVHGFLHARSATVKPGYGKDEVVGKEDELKDALFEDDFKVTSALTQFEKNINTMEDITGTNYHGLMVDRLIASGLKLSINNVEAWKKELTKLANKKIGKKADMTEVWISFAAKQMLKNWPYSYEELYSKRLKTDAGEALRQTIENYTGEKNAYGLDVEQAAEIAKVVAEHNTNMYRGISLDMRKQLDVALKNTTYSEKAFKLLFDPVKVGDSGEPADSASVGNRFHNEYICRCFVERNKDGVMAKDSQARQRWNEVVLSTLGSVAKQEIKAEMLTKEFLKKNFAFAYDYSRRFLAAKEIYEHEKDLLEDTKACAKCNVLGGEIRKIKNAFDADNDNVYERFFLAVEAYAKAHFVDEEGRFDLGLTNEEINSAEAFGKGKKEDKNAKKQRESKYGEIIEGKLRERQYDFDLQAGNIRAQVNRRIVADNLIKSNEMKSLMSFINVTGEDNIFQVVRKEGFRGNLDDMSILFQDKYLAKPVTEYVEAVRKIQQNMQKIQSLESEIHALRAAKKDPEPKMIEAANLSYEIRPLQARLPEIKQEIESYDLTSKISYEKYLKAHNVKGDLIHEVEVEGGTTLPVLPGYVEFQSRMGEDMYDAYKQYKELFKNDKKGNMMTPEAIEKLLLKPDWIVEFHKLQRLDLYLGLLEQDSKNFKVGKKNVVLEEVKKQAEVQMKTYEEYKKGGDKVAEVRHEQAKRVNGLNGAAKMIETFEADIKKKDKTADKVHEYVRMIYATIKRMGVGLDGSLTSDVIAEKTGENLNKDQKKKIVKEEEQKNAELLFAMEHGEEAVKKARKSSRSGKSGKK